MCKNPYDRFKWQMVRFSVCSSHKANKTIQKTCFKTLYKVQKCLVLEVFLPSLSTGIKKKSLRKKSYKHQTNQLQGESQHCNFDMKQKTWKSDKKTRYKTIALTRVKNYNAAPLMTYTKNDREIYKTIDLKG